MSPESVEVVEQEILDYLRRHPTAQDTVEGIAEWWLQRREQDVVRKALDHLVLMKEVKSFISADGRRHYSALMGRR